MINNVLFFQKTIDKNFTFKSQLNRIGIIKSIVFQRNRNILCIMILQQDTF